MEQLAKQGIEAEMPKRKITFEDYEKFLEKLEKEGKLEAIAESNPKVNRS